MNDQNNTQNHLAKRKTRTYNIARTKETDMIDSFRIDHPALEKYCETKKITLLQKGILISILLKCWANEKRGSTQESSKNIAIELGCSEIDVSDTVSLFSEGKWLAEEFCMDSFELVVNSPYLIEEHKKNLEEIEAKNKETARAKRERAIAEASLVKLINNPEIEDNEPTMAYLKHEDRCTQFYRGWLPTNRFNQSGQVYCITENIMNELKAEFPFVDVNSCVLAIHGWLSKNTTRRKTFAKMPDFIRFWITNSTNNGASTSNESVDFSSVEQQLDKLIG
jgi:hypothetical protein